MSASRVIAPDACTRNHAARGTEGERQLDIKPDFVIAGAMKCGTTTLHALLAQHPQIFIPRDEVHLFAIDDIEQFPQASAQAGGRLIHQNFEQYFEAYNAWYTSLFAGAEPGQLRGEDSTTYLPSRRAIDRIAAYLPETKVLVLLRDPVERVYSQYWHWVRTYRAIYSLEDTIRFQHGNLLQRSCYEEQIRYCFSRLPRERVKVILFEEFIRDQAGVLREVLRFLNVDDAPIRVDDKHANKGKYPRYPQLALWSNYIARRLYGRQYRSQLPRIVEPGGQTGLGLEAWLKRVTNFVNPMTDSRPQPAEPATRAFLSKILYERNAGLPALLDVDLGRHWPTFQQAARE